MSFHDSYASHAQISKAVAIVEKHRAWEMFNFILRTAGDFTIFEFNVVVWRKKIKFSDIRPLWEKIWGPPPIDMDSR